MTRLLGKRIRFAEEHVNRSAEIAPVVVPRRADLSDQDPGGGDGLHPTLYHRAGG